MKKLLSVIAMFCIVQMQSFASECEYYCAKPPYPVGGSVAHIVSNITGMNFLFTKIAETAMQSELKKETGSNFNVEIKAFGGKNLMDGKFKSMTANTKSINYSGVRASDIKVESLCSYNRVVIKDNDLLFPENFVLKYSGKITSSDLQAMVVSQEYLNMLNKMTVSIANKVLFKIYDPSAKIENNKIKMSYKVVTPFLFTTNTSTIDILASLKVENSKIVFSDVQVGSPNNKIDLSKIMSLVNYLNPFTTEVAVSKSTRGISKIKNVQFINNQIHFDGLFIIPKNYVITK